MRTADFKIDVKEFVGWLLVCGIFMERYYEMLMIALSLMLIYRINNRFYVKKNIVAFLLFVFVYSIVCISIVGYEYNKFVQQFFVLLFFVLGYSVVVDLFKNEIDNLFQKYLKLAYYVSLLGILQFIVFFLFQINIFASIYNVISVVAIPRVLRITSIISEPSYLSTILTPAVIYCFWSSIFPLDKRKIVLLLAVFLTFSAISYLILFFFFVYRYVYLRSKSFFFVIVGFFLALLLFYGGRNNDDASCSNTNVFGDVVLKIQDTYYGLKDLDPENFEVLNLSSYATIVNIWVAINAPSRIFGTGLGTHELNYYNEYQSDYAYYGLNAQDGYSLFNRLFSEFGLFGIIVCMFWMIKHINNKNVYNMSILFLIITLLIRGGHYVRYGFIFWLFLFYYTSSFIESKSNLNK